MSEEDNHAIDDGSYANMKAIHQLIEYFHGQGALDDAHIDQLVATGFLPSRWYNYDDEWDWYEPYPRGPLESLDDDLPVADAGLRRKGRGRASKSRRVVFAPEIAAQLEAQFPQWNDGLAGLIKLASRLAPVSDWRDAAVSIRQADLGKISAALQAGLKEHAPSIKELWTALEMRQYQEVVKGTDRKGPAISAFRAVLSAPSHEALGKYAWILKLPPISDVYNLLEAKRGVLQAAGKLLDQDRATVAIALGRSHHEVAYWALLLLFNARRAALRERPDYEREHRGAADGNIAGCADLPANPKTIGVVMRAWTHAMIMESSTVLKFLMTYLAEANQDLESCLELFQPCGVPLFCPVGWPGKHYLYE